MVRIVEARAPSKQTCPPISRFRRFHADERRLSVVVQIRLRPRMVISSQRRPLPTGAVLQGDRHAQAHRPRPHPGRRLRRGAVLRPVLPASPGRPARRLRTVAVDQRPPGQSGSPHRPGRSQRPDQPTRGDPPARRVQQSATAGGQLSSRRRPSPSPTSVPRSSSTPVTDRGSRSTPARPIWTAASTRASAAARSADARPPACAASSTACCGWRPTIVAAA